MKEFIIIADSWGFEKGGINSFNFDFCNELGKHSPKEYIISCFVPYAEKTAVDIAKENNVNLISVFPSNKELITPQTSHNFISKEEHISIYADNIIKKLNINLSQTTYFIGHDIITGFIAIKCKEKLFNLTKTVCIVLHHMTFKYYEGYKVEKPQTEINNKINIQRILFESEHVDVAIGIGPKLVNSIKEINPNIPIIEFIPGLSTLKNLNENVVTGDFKLITFGRFDSDHIKNMSLVAKAFGLLISEEEGNKYIGPDTTLTIAGLSDVNKETEELKLLINKKSNLVGLEYITHRNRLFKELKNNHVCLMLSIHEGFGLVGLEAISCEVPLILTKNSGLYEYLNNRIPNFEVNFKNCILISGTDDSDITTIKKLLLNVANEKEAYKKRASELKKILLSQGLIDGNSLVGLTWENVINKLHKQLDYVIIDSNNNYSSTSKLNNFNINTNKLQEEYFQTISNSPYDLKVLLNKKGLLLIPGIAGLGKTFLARKVGAESLNDYDIVWFFDCGDVLKSKNLQRNFKIKESYKQFAIFLYEFINNRSVSKATTHFEYENDSIDSIISQIHEAIKPYSWLLIFDNACDVATREFLYDFRVKFIPSTNLSKKQHVIITSKNEIWNELEISSFKVLKWTDSDIENYFHSGSTIIKIGETNKYNLKLFGGIPLAVSIAKKFMIEKNLTLEKYFERWNNAEQKIKLLKHSISDYNNKISVYTSVKISYDTLANRNQKKLLKIISFLAPDEFPMEWVFMHKKNKSLIKNKFGTNDYYRIHDEIIVPLAKYSLLEWLTERTSTFDYNINDLYSIHRIVREVIQLLQTDSDRMENNFFLIYLLNNAFDQSSPRYYIYWSLIPHIGHINSFINKNFKTMTMDLQYNSASLLYKSAVFRYYVGDIEIAETQYRDAKYILEEIIYKNGDNQDAKSLLSDLKIKLSKTIFLTSELFYNKKSSNEALRLANEAKDEVKLDYLKFITCKSDLLAKIYQRMCLFNQSENELQEAKEIVFEKLNLLKKDNDEYYNLTGNLASILHNFGSLYWTRGFVNDYENAESFIKQAFTIQDERIDYYKSRIRTLEINSFTYAPDDTPIEMIKLESYKEQLNKQELYQHVSRMILGSVYGLVGRFSKQEEEHKLAFTFFKDTAMEKRRFSYTVFYMLHFGWDKEKSGYGKPFDNGEFKEYNLLKYVFQFHINLKKDEKYQIILMILALRLSVRRESYILSDPEILKLPIFATIISAEEAHKNLWNQLKLMSFGDIYYDVDTCSVSAFIDYAQYLETKNSFNEANIVAEHVTKLIKAKYVYHRKAELDLLFIKLNNAQSSD